MIGSAFVGYHRRMFRSQAAWEFSGVDEVDKRHRLDDEVFSFQVTKDQRVRLFWHERHVKTLAGAEARRLLDKLDGLDGHDLQLALAKATGNFKRGNERPVRRR